MEENIEKTRKKAGMSFSANFDSRKTSLPVYIKYWKSACLMSLTFGAEVFCLSTPLLEKLEQCQR